VAEVEQHRGGELVEVEMMRKKLDAAN